MIIWVFVRALGQAWGIGIGNHQTKTRASGHSIYISRALRFLRPSFSVILLILVFSLCASTLLPHSAVPAIP